jgi:hypothetical protein
VADGKDMWATKRHQRYVINGMSSTVCHQRYVINGMPSALKHQKVAKWYGQRLFRNEVACCACELAGINCMGSAAFGERGRGRS